MENITSAQKNKMAMTFGVLLGLMYMVVASIENMFISQLFLFYAMKVVFYAIILVVMGVFAARVRKANGGFIEFREIFGAIFVMILVSGVIYYIYNYIYFAYIDPDFMLKIKNSTITMMEKRGVGSDVIDQTAEKLDKQIAESKTFSLGKNLMSFLGMLLLDSIFGLIVAAIVKRPKPMFFEG